MNILSFESICIFLLPQGMFKVVILHQWFLSWSWMLPCLQLEFLVLRNERQIGASLGVLWINL